MVGAFEQAWAFLKADFSDLSGGEGLGNSRAKMFAQFAQYARDDGRDEDAKQMEQASINALVGELTEEDLARLFHGQNYDPHMEGTPLQVYPGKITGQTQPGYGMDDRKRRLGTMINPKTQMPYISDASTSGDGEGRFTDFRALEDGYINPKGPLGTGEQR